MAYIEIDESRCKGCGLCTLACPRKLVAMSDSLNRHGYLTAIAINQDKCTGCTLCAEMCPDVAIAVFK